MSTAQFLTERVESKVSRVVLLLQVPDTGDWRNGSPSILDSLTLDEGDEAYRAYPEQGVHRRDLLKGGDNGEGGQRTNGVKARARMRHIFESAVQNLLRYALVEHRLTLKPK